MKVGQNICAYDILGCTEQVSFFVYQVSDFGPFGPSCLYEFVKSVFCLVCNRKEFRFVFSYKVKCFNCLFICSIISFYVISLLYLSSTDGQVYDA